MPTLLVDGETHAVDAPDEMPLLWVLRDLVGKTGTRFGCGRGLCGACTVHLDGQAVRSCITPVSMAAGKPVTTIEGLASGVALHPVQQAWVDHGVPQCGYCQAGQIMQAAALLARSPRPTDAQIEAGMAGNLCRCGTYTRIRDAIRSVAADGGEE